MAKKLSPERLNADVGRPAEPPEKAEEQPLAPEQRAALALASQGQPLTLIAALSPEQIEALSQSLGDDNRGRAEETDAEGNVLVPSTAMVVRDVMVEFYEQHKATSAETEEGETAVLRQPADLLENPGGLPGGGF